MPLLGEHHRQRINNPVNLRLRLAVQSLEQDFAESLKTGV